MGPILTVDFQVSFTTLFFEVLRPLLFNRFDKSQELYMYVFGLLASLIKSDNNSQKPCYGPQNPGLVD